MCDSLSEYLKGKVRAFYYENTKNFILGKGEIHHKKDHMLLVLFTLLLVSSVAYIST